MASRNFAHLQVQRTLDERKRIKFERNVHVTDAFIDRLGLERELKEHSGCVNCLEWNQKGDLLISGSDDLDIVLWKPFEDKKILSIPSGHTGNIFSVKFLGGSNDNGIVSGAADYKIRVHDVQAKETTMSCSCHLGRVKRLAATPNVPFVFWSAAEDGLILQFDVRTPHRCRSPIKNVLIDLSKHVQTAEAKCLDVNPMRPELLVVGANDPYIRLYDRRMIPSRTFDTSLPSDESGTVQEDEGDALNPGSVLPQTCATYYVAGHLPAKKLEYQKKFRTLASTYVTFSPDGNELLANLGGEQIYLFDVVKPNRPKSFCTKPFDSLAHTNGYSKTSQPTSSHSSRIVRRNGLSFKVEALKERANELFKKGDTANAIALYNVAIVRCPDAAVLYSNRAAALLKRGWDGDLYAALRDCHEALRLDIGFVKAHFRLARCLFELKWLPEAQECIEQFKKRFTEEAKTPAVAVLDKDIAAAVLAANVKKETNGCCNGNLKKASFVFDTFSEPENSPSIVSHFEATGHSGEEADWEAAAHDYVKRFCGHCNTTTDIKEANFFGSNGQFIVAGSDDGYFFVWDRKTTNIMRVMKGDDSIVNCLQPHPSICTLATSGIDPVVRIWSPRPDDGSANAEKVADTVDAAIQNQRRMNANPLEVMFMNMGYRGVPAGGHSRDQDEEEGDGEGTVQCMPS